MARVEIAAEQLEQLAREAQFNCRVLAQLCRVSLRQLQREFRQRFGCSPHAWLSALRMRIAREQLMAGESVKKVALDLGYKQSSHFCRQFKASTSATPSEFVLANLALAACRGQITSVAAR